MKLGIDAMSGDLGSAIVVEACRSFLSKNKTDELYVVGKKEELLALESYSQVTIIDAQEVLEMTENILAIRRKKESSMVKTMMLAKNDEVDAVLSCGNTGAYYASAMLFLKRLEDVEKSCLMAMLPTYNDRGVALLDVGANSENTAEQLKSFAIMGSVYAKNVRKVNNPKVALLNIGAEHHKGDEGGGLAGAVDGGGGGVKGDLSNPAVLDRQRTLHGRVDEGHGVQLPGLIYQALARLDQVDHIGAAVLGLGEAEVIKEVQGVPAGEGGQGGGDGDPLVQFQRPVLGHLAGGIGPGEF